MITIHHATQSRSLRVVWFCEEAAIPYRLEHIEMFSAAMKKPEFLKIHPLGKVPAIDDDGFVLWETTAILHYLSQHHANGAFFPDPGTREGASHLQWLAFGENPLTVVMGEIAAHGGAMPEEQRIPALAERGREIAPGIVRVVERALESSPYIAGEEFTAADIMLAFGLLIARHLNYVDEATTPRTAAYCDRVLARPAFQRAVAAG